MKKILIPALFQGICILAFTFIPAACKKQDTLTNPVLSEQTVDESVSSGYADYSYYYSVADKRLYVSENYMQLCKVELDITVVSQEKWVIGFPAKAEIEPVIMKGDTFSYNGIPNAADIRQRPRHACTGEQPARDECKVVGSRSARVVTVPFRYCVRTGNPVNLCVEEYKLVGTGTAFNSTTCTGEQIGAAGVYKWVCM